MPDWLALACVLVLAAVLGVVRSRTILIYPIALAPLVIGMWFFVRRAAVVMGIMLALVVAMQVLSPLVASAVVPGGFQSALERAGSAGFSGSGRYYEWLKAWEAFKAAPWLGHGWDGFAAQSFLINNYPGGYRPYDMGVLFNHCHNLVLQLLATIGSVGTLIVVGGFFAVVGYGIRKACRPETGFVAAMLLVSLCHSMLEYPLWYVYFLMVFVVLFALLSDDAKQVTLLDRHGKESVIGKAGFIGFLLAMAVLVSVVRLAGVYGQMMVVDGHGLSTEEAWTKEVNQLMYLYDHEPILRVQALVPLAIKTRHFAHSSDIPTWAPKISAVLAEQRPYGLAFAHGLYLERAGKHQEADAWLDKIYRYYPEYIAGYNRELKNDQQFARLYPQIDRACADSARLLPDLEPCTAKAPKPAK